jgi:hypothetical protein
MVFGSRMPDDRCRMADGRNPRDLVEILGSQRTQTTDAGWPMAEDP